MPAFALKRTGCAYGWSHRRYRSGKSEVAKVFAWRSEPALAGSLNNLSVRLSESGDRAGRCARSKRRWRSVAGWPIDRAGVALEDPQLAAALEIPHLRRAIIGGGDGASAFRRHRHGVDAAGMAFEGLQFAAALDPQAQPELKKYRAVPQ